MIPVINPAEAARLDRSTDIPVDVLMERAGHGVASAAFAMGTGYGKRVVVLAGPGNNGGDGYVAARLLRRRGAAVRVEALADPRTLPALNARGKAHAAGVQVTELGHPSEADLVIDALFGGGFRSGLEPRVRRWIDSELPVLSIDFPSGLDPTNGTIAEAAFSATRTVTFHAPKTGHLLAAGPDHTGHLSVVDIGLAGGEPELAITEESDAPRPIRPRRSHKWSAGSVLVVGGDQGMTGAAIFAGRSALRFGAGAVGLAVPPESELVAAAAAPDLLHHRLADLPDRYDVLLIGPGLGRTRIDLVMPLIEGWKGSVLVDADALAAIPIDRLLGVGNIVLTPHAGEFSRLVGRGASYQAAGELARATGTTVLLKGNPTVVTDGGLPWIVNSGGPELATIGTGDVLAGMVAALMAAGTPPPLAARSAAYWHGRAGAEAARRGAVTAADLLDQIGRFS
ncbi:MAG: NAD(P)H-hydrate dehydratase [Actinomycetota bacterium]